MAEQIEHRDTSSRIVSKPKSNKGKFAAAALAIAGILSQYSNSNSVQRDNPEDNVVVAPNPINPSNEIQRSHVSSEPDHLETVNTEQQVIEDPNSLLQQVAMEDPASEATEVGASIFDAMIANQSYLTYLGRWNDFWNEIRSQCRSQGVGEHYVANCVAGVQRSIEEQKDAHYTRANEAAQNGDQATSRREAELGIKVEALASPEHAFEQAISRGYYDVALDVYRHAPAQDLMGHEPQGMLVPHVGFDDLASSATVMHDRLTQMWPNLSDAERAAILARIRYETSGLFDHPQMTPGQESQVNGAIAAWESFLHRWFPGEPLRLPLPDDEEGA